MFNIILYSPQIPPNTGNIVRLCSNTGCKLHLIRPLGFNLNIKSFRRAGLDYHALSEIFEYDNLDDCLLSLNPSNFFIVTKFGTKNYSEVNYFENDALMFGSETKGLPMEIIDRFSHERKLFIPMAQNSRSLNLSNAVSIVVYNAWKSIKYKGSANK